MPPTTKTIEDMNKKIIRITSIEDYGRNHEMFCDKVLMLRYARRAGDTEVINHTQLEALRKHPSFGSLTPMTRLVSLYASIRYSASYIHHGKKESGILPAFLLS